MKIQIKHTVLDNTTKQVLFGGLLGDGYLIRNAVSKHYKYAVCHGTRQREYLKWKARKLKMFYPSICRTNCPTAFDGVMYKLETRISPLFTQLRQVFYPNNKKAITRTVLSELDELVLLIWYLDDGATAYESSAIRLSTHCFAYKENILIQQWLQEKFGCLARVNKCLDQFVIRIGQMNTFLNLFQELEAEVPQCMKYKLGNLTNEGRDLIRIKKQWRRKYERKRYRERLRGGQK